MKHRLKLFLLLTPVSIVIAALLVSLFYRCGIVTVSLTLVVGLFFAWLLSEKINLSKYVTYIRTALVLINVVIVVLFLLFSVAFSTNDERRATPDGHRKQALGSLRVVAEVYFSDNQSSYSGFCSSKEFDQYLVRIDDIYKENSCYGPLLQKYFDDDQSRTQCNASEQEYAVATYLSDVRKYWCIDATPFVGYAKAPKSGSLTCEPDNE